MVGLKYNNETSGITEQLILDFWVSKAQWVMNGRVNVMLPADCLYFLTDDTVSIAEQYRRI